MVEFRNEDLSGSTFDDVDLTGARFNNVHLQDVTVRGAWADLLDLDGDFGELLYNGIDVIPLWEAEMTRLHPEFALLRPDDADGYRRVWPLLEQKWADLVQRARAVPEEVLHERVDDEWSFIETQRHMLFVHDAWLRRAVLGEPRPYDPLDLGHAEMGKIEGVPYDPDARPSLDDVLSRREERFVIARELVAGLSDDRLAGSTTVEGIGYPEAGTYPVQRCLRAVVNEEWWHHRFAERDLTVLEARS